jgi:DHA1 family inner membrane transport protein
MAARVATALAHGTFFGVGSVVAISLVAHDKRASAVALMFSGLTLANILGVPLGTWLGQQFGWRATFGAVTLIGVAALIVIAVLVPKGAADLDDQNWRSDLRTIARGSVLLGLLTTVFGYAGVFAVFTYITPALTQITGFSDAAVSPILLVFGVGLVAGNRLGGKLADRNLTMTVLGTLATLGIVLLLMTFALHQKTAAVLFVGLLGAAGFATVPPLQMWVLGKAQGAGQSLVSSFNIAAFNLGNALGAWVGGQIIDFGPGIAMIPLIAALFPAAAVLIALFSRQRDRGPSQMACASTLDPAQ